MATQQLNVRVDPTVIDDISYLSHLMRAKSNVEVVTTVVHYTPPGRRSEGGGAR